MQLETAFELVEHKAVSTVDSSLKLDCGTQDAQAKTLYLKDAGG